MKIKQNNGQHVGGNAQQKTNTRCAPGLKFEDGHCAKLQTLIELVSAYNLASPNNPIKLSQNFEGGTKKQPLDEHSVKRHLVSQLEDKLRDTCGDDHECWTKQPFVKNMEKSAKRELLKFTYRPKSPQGRFAWLSNFDINDSMAQYERQFGGTFKFFGAVPMDFADLPYLEINHVDYPKLIASGKTKVGIIFNLDDHYQSGSHWVAMFTNFKEGSAYYFDSYGIAPEKRVRDLMKHHVAYIKKLKKVDDIKIDYNKTRHQHGDSECGVYSMNFLIRMARGDDFYKLCKKPVSDKQINKCRLVYFNYKKHKKI